MRKLCFSLAIMVLCFLLQGCNEHSHLIESISIEYPYGETRLVIWKNGTASLLYGALPQSEVIKTGIFDIEDLCKHLKPRLHRNNPREEWPNPKATYGMVHVKFEKEGEREYLIFEEQGFAEELFSKAKQNIVGKRQ